MSHTREREREGEREKEKERERDMPSCLSNRHGMEEAVAPCCWRQPSHLLLEVDGTRVRYVGPGNDDSDAAAVRSNRPVPRATPIYYFEVDVINRGRDGYIGIGFSGANVNMQRLPGWDCHSYGYHGDDGNVFEWSGRGRSYGPVFGTGDTVGAALDWVTRSISFFKNGVNQGIAFVDVWDEVLYATVGCRTPGEELDANFGDREFKVDYAEMHKGAVQRTVAAIMLTAVRPTLSAGAGGTASNVDTDREGNAKTRDGETDEQRAITTHASKRRLQERKDAEGGPDADAETGAAGAGSSGGAGKDGDANGRGGGVFVNMDAFLAKDRADAVELYHVIEYLLHYGYTETAESLIRAAFAGSTNADNNASASGSNDNNVDIVSESVMDAARSRSRAMQCVVSGNVEEAIRIVDEMCPGLVLGQRAGDDVDMDMSNAAEAASDGTSKGNQLAAGVALRLKCLQLVPKVNIFPPGDDATALAENLNNAMIHSSTQAAWSASAAAVNGDGKAAPQNPNSTPPFASRLIPLKPISSDPLFNSMSRLERLVRHTAALLDTMKWMDDPEAGLAAELNVLPVDI